jgi:hypothetical protein
MKTSVPLFRFNRSFAAGLLAGFAMLLAPLPVHSQSSLSDLTITSHIAFQPAGMAVEMMKFLANGSIYSIRARGNDAPVLTFDTNSTAQQTLFLWESGCSAFRAGLFCGTAIGTGSMGIASAGFGLNVSAYHLSMAGGAMANASGFGSFAYGQNATAAGAWSAAIGDGALSAGADSFSAGIAVTATGGAAIALGGYNLAAGDFSLVSGLGTRADAYASVAVGHYNLGGYSGPDGAHQWNLEDPLFEIGNGTAPSAETNWLPVRSNVLTVFKDGRVIIHKPQGDILMGEFGN